MFAGLFNHGGTAPGPFHLYYYGGTAPGPFPVEEERPRGHSPIVGLGAVPSRGGTAPGPFPLDNIDGPSGT